MNSFLSAWLCSALLCISGAACAAGDGETLLNDLHSRLNPTPVRAVLYPESADEVISIVRQAGRDKQAISISGGRHSMGGQQFGTDTLHLSMSKMNDVLAFDKDSGVITVEAGIQWPALIEYLLDTQQDDVAPWGIVKKQTGADELSIGGAVSSNVHGRGLGLRPIVQDIVALRLVTADAREIELSRTRHPELFRLVVGGYGLFGVITSVDLKLMPRIKLRRDVEILSLAAFEEKISQRIADGYLYGDLQFKTDEQAEDFLKVGVFSTYKNASIPQHPSRRSSAD